MNVLIIGASGLVGSNCLKYFKEQDQAEWSVLGTYYSFPTDETVYFNTLDPKDERNADLDSFNPDVIVHTGALTFVDYCEDHVEESYERTVNSTKCAISLANKFNARLVFISTDYVFDGKSGPYSEEDETNPLGIYAKHKLEAEELVLKNVPGSLVLRVNTIYGDDIRQNNFVARVISQVEEGKEWSMNLPLDQYSTPVNAKDIARSMFVLLRDGKNGIYNISSSDWMSRVQLANRVLKYYPDHKCTVIPTFTSDLTQKAPRPLRAGLITNKFLAAYPDFTFTNVDDYMLKRRK